MSDRGDRLYALLGFWDTRDLSPLGDLVRSAREGYERSHPDMGPEPEAWAEFDRLHTDELGVSASLAHLRPETDEAMFALGWEVAHVRCLVQHGDLGPHRMHARNVIFVDHIGGWTDTHGSWTPVDDHSHMWIDARFEPVSA